MAVKNYRQLVVWQKAMKLVKQIYETTTNFTREETYGLTSQIRRAAVSIPSNIAEGQGRDSTKEFIRHLSIVYGSLMETETQILIAESLNYLNSNESNNLLEKTSEVGRMLNGLKRSLKNKTDHRPPTTDH